jgi:C4-dicarboxylate transporter DctM subunit
MDDPLLTGLATFALVFLYLGLGTWVFAGLLLVSVSSLTLILGFPLERVGAIAKGIMWSSASTWELAAIPIFMLMGELMFRTDVSERLFRGLSPLVQAVPGGLIHTNIAGCTLFAAVSGSSTATTLTVGKITSTALRERGYDTNLSIGSLAGAGSLGLLIPPSIVMIVYGILAEVSISQLFIAGFLPGLLIATLYSSFIAARAIVDPSLVPEDAQRYTTADRLRGVLDLLPVLVLIVIVLGSIYSGVATPSEAAAIGLAGTVVITLLFRQLTWSVILESLISAVCTSAMVCSIVVAAALLSTTMGYLHVPQDVARLIAAAEFGPYQLILVLGAFYIVLGLFLDGISITLPLIVRAGFDPLWFGIFLVIMVELGQITPPVGFNLFVLQGLTGHTISRVAYAALPFFFLMLLATVLITAWPEIALWLPRTMRQ